MRGATCSGCQVAEHSSAISMGKSSVSGGAPNRSTVSSADVMAALRVFLSTSGRAFMQMVNSIMTWSGNWLVGWLI
jgi:hypothetical protein